MSLLSNPTAPFQINPLDRSFHGKLDTNNSVGEDLLIGVQSVDHPRFRTIEPSQVNLPSLNNEEAKAINFNTNQSV